MKNIRNDYCIRMFVGNDNLRPAMQHVSLENGVLYATNAHVIAKIDANLCGKEYKSIEKYPDAKSVFESHKSSESKTISVDDLFHDLMKIDVVFKPKMIECDNCDGDGVAICDYCNSEHKCKECGGTGKIKTSEMVLSDEFTCKLFNRSYSLNYLDMIIRTAVFLKVENIEISNGENKHRGSVFIVGDMTILLMPKYN